MSDEESDGPISGAEVAEPRAQAQLRQLRITRLLASAALLLSATSAVAMASVALRSPAPALPAVVPLGEVTGLYETGAVKGLQGWYRTYLDIAVRVAEAPNSEKVQVLPAGSLVFAAEVRGNGARLLKPVEGWVSMSTEEGIEVLRPDETYRASPAVIDEEEILRSREMRESNEKRQATAMRMTAVQQQLAEALHRLEGAQSHAGGALRGKWPHIVRQAPEMGERLAKETARRSEDFFRRVARDHGPEVQKVVRSAKLEQLMGRVHHGEAERSVAEERQSATELDDTTLVVREEAVQTPIGLAIE